MSLAQPPSDRTLPPQTRPGAGGLASVFANANANANESANASATASSTADQQNLLARQVLHQLLGQFDALPPMSDPLQTRVTCRQAAVGTQILARTGKACDLVILVHGVVVKGLASTDGPFQPEIAVTGPAWLDISSAWLERGHVQDALVKSPALLLYLPVDAVHEALVRCPQLALPLLRALASQVHQLTHTAEGLMHKDALARLAVWLQERSEPISSEPTRTRVEMTQRKRDIAAQLAITPETLSRLLRQLTRQGLVHVHGYTVEVLKPHALAALATG